MDFFWSSRGLSVGAWSKQTSVLRNLKLALNPISAPALGLALLGLSSCDLPQDGPNGIDTGSNGSSNLTIPTGVGDSTTNSSPENGSSPADPNLSTAPGTTDGNVDSTWTSSPGSSTDSDQSHLPDDKMDQPGGKNNGSGKPGDKGPGDKQGCPKGKGKWKDKWKGGGCESVFLDHALWIEIHKRGLRPLRGKPRIRPELVELGRNLAFDKILSGNRNVSCMTCHHPTFATGDGRHLPMGIDAMGLGPSRVGDSVIPRNAPPLFNLQHYPIMFWDGRIEEDPEVDGGLITPAGSELLPEMVEVFEFGVVSAQAMFPVTSGDEMRGHGDDNEIASAQDFGQIWSRLMDRLMAIQGYRDGFAAAYPGIKPEDLNFAHAANAISAFEIDAFSLSDSPWQRYLRGNIYALTKRQKQGALKFFASGCGDCHKGSMFSDFEFHNTGLAQFGPGKLDNRDDIGRGAITERSEDRYRFRTPPLVNIELSAPYGHVGQFPTLAGHIQHYLKPKQSLTQYDIEQQVAATESFLWSTRFDNTQELLQSLDPQVLDLKPFSVPLIVEFLQSLTDPKAKNTQSVVPKQVPSGLEVEY